MMSHLFFIFHIESSHPVCMRKFGLMLKLWKAALPEVGFEHPTLYKEVNKAINPHWNGTLYTMPPTKVRFCRMGAKEIAAHKAKTRNRWEREGFKLSVCCFHSGKHRRNVQWKVRVAWLMRWQVSRTLSLRELIGKIYKNKDKLYMYSASLSNSWPWSQY